MQFKEKYMNNKFLLLLWRLPFKTEKMKQFLEKIANKELQKKKQELIKLNWQRYELECQLKQIKEK